jgi:hypothetical protein
MRVLMIGGLRDGMILFCLQILQETPGLFLMATGRLVVRIIFSIWIVVEIRIIATTPLSRI